MPEGKGRFLLLDFASPCDDAKETPPRKAALPGLYARLRKRSRARNWPHLKIDLENQWLAYAVTCYRMFISLLGGIVASIADPADEKAPEGCANDLSSRFQNMIH